MKTARAFTGVLYMDSEVYDCAESVANLGVFFDEFAWIEHDKDKDEDGALKKSHIHWVGRKKNATTISKVSKVAGVSDNMIEFCNNFKKMVRYLVHADNPNKYQYSLEDIVCDFDLTQYLVTKNEGQVVLSFVEKRLSGATYMQLLKDSIADGTYSELRRNYGFIKVVTEEEQQVRADSSLEDLIERIVKRKADDEWLRFVHKEGIQECFEF